LATTTSAALAGVDVLVGLAMLLIRLKPTTMTIQATTIPPMMNKTVLALLLFLVP
jgi:hypothetical protein